MKIIDNNKKMFVCIIIAVLMLGIGSFLCFSDKSLAISYYDAVAKSYGVGGIRVHNTDEFINQFDSLMKNKKTGIYHFVSDPQNETIDANKIKTWVQSKYVLNDYYKNYYKYSEKGEYEPYRFNPLDASDFSGDFYFDMNMIRTTGERQQKGEFVGNRLKQKLDADTDFKKIYNVYQYILSTTTYNGNPEFHELINSGTDIYSVLVDKHSVCIGFAIAFSYMMDLYGINSYIVDNITSVDPSTKSYSSTHTYNVVELNNKYYIVDITSRLFLTAGNSNTIKGGSINLSYSNYRFNNDEEEYMRDTNIDINCMNSVISEAKNLKIERTTACNGTTKPIDFSEIDYGVGNVDSNYISTTKPIQNSTVQQTTSQNVITSVKRNSEGQEEIVNIDIDVSDQNKVVEMFTSIKSENGTTKIITYRIDENGNYIEVTPEEVNKIEKSNKAIKEKNSARTKNVIVGGFIAIVVVLIGFQINKRMKLNKGKGYTTFTFYVDK